MNPRHKLIVVLLAEDDPDDRLLAKEVLEESGLVPLLACVEDGEELMDYLYRRSKYAPAGSIAATAADPAGCEYAEKDGREALSEIKADPELRRIPIVMLTTSKAPEHIVAPMMRGPTSTSPSR